MTIALQWHIFVLRLQSLRYLAKCLFFSTPGATCVPGIYVEVGIGEISGELFPPVRPGRRRSCGRQVLQASALMRRSPGVTRGSWSAILESLAPLIGQAGAQDCRLTLSYLICSTYRRVRRGDLELVTVYSGDCFRLTMFILLCSSCAFRARFGMFFHEFRSVTSLVFTGLSHHIGQLVWRRNV